MIERLTLNQLLDHSTEVINAYETHIKSEPKEKAKFVEKHLNKEHSGDPLSDLVMSLATTSIGLTSVLEKKRVEPIDTEKLKALQLAIEKLMISPTTENKINAIQFAMFGYNMPLLRALEEMQNLLKTVEALKRGKRVSRVEGMESLQDEA